LTVAWRSNLLDEPRARTAHAQHQKIIDAIACRDRVDAETRKHVLASLKYRLARIATNSLTGNQDS